MTSYRFQESLSGQQSNFFAANDFLGGSKLNDFTNIQGKMNASVKVPSAIRLWAEHIRTFALCFSLHVSSI